MTSRGAYWTHQCTSSCRLHATKRRADDRFLRAAAGLDASHAKILQALGGAHARNERETPTDPESGLVDRVVTDMDGFERIMYQQMVPVTAEEAVRHATWQISSPLVMDSTRWRWPWSRKSRRVKPAEPEVQWTVEISRALGESDIITVMASNEAEALEHAGWSYPGWVCYNAQRVQ